METNITNGDKKRVVNTVIAIVIIIAIMFACIFVAGTIPTPIVA